MEHVCIHVCPCMYFVCILHNFFLHSCMWSCMFICIFSLLFVHVLFAYMCLSDMLELYFVHAMSILCVYRFNHFPKHWRSIPQGLAASLGITSYLHEHSNRVKPAHVSILMYVPIHMNAYMYCVYEALSVNCCARIRCSLLHCNVWLYRPLYSMSYLNVHDI